MLREMPEQFVCDACATRHHLDLLCPGSLRRQGCLCVRCCGCDVHRLDDPGGIAVFAGTPLTWRGFGP